MVTFVLSIFFVALTLACLVLAWAESLFARGTNRSKGWIVIALIFGSLAAWGFHDLLR